MRTSFPFFALAALLTMAACSDDEVMGGGSDSLLRLSTVNTISETRATSQELQLEQFANEAKVAIFLVENVNGEAKTEGTNVTEYDQPLGYTADGNGNLNPADNNKQYWPTSGNGLHIYGVYPYSAVTSSDDAKKYDATNVSFTVKDNQSDDADYNASDLMTGAPMSNNAVSNPVSRTSSAVPLTFTHLLSKININLEAGDGFNEGDLNNATVSILNTLPTTTFNVQNTTLGTASGAVTPITVCTGTKGSAIIVPQTVTKGTAFIKVVVGEGSYFYKLDSETGTTFEGQKQYTYEITVNKTKLTVTSKITDWTSGSDKKTGTASLE